MADTHSVSWEVEQITERWDPDPRDKDVEPIDLPGLFNVYLVIDGGRILFDQITAGRVHDAIAAAKANQPQATEPAPTTEPTTAPQPTEPQPQV